jgi:hypothetical protein
MGKKGAHGASTFGVLVVLLGAQACHDARTSITPDWVSGSRLRAHLSVAGEARIFSGWFDSKLKIDCFFGLDADGRTRCLPPYVGRGSEGSDGVFYRDAACTDRIAGFYRKQPPTYVQDADTHAPLDCTKGLTIYATGAVTAPTAVWEDLDGCAPLSASTISDLSFVEVREVDPSSFVGATETHEPRGPRLSARVLVAEDGARELTGLYDEDRHEECIFEARADKTSLCAPYHGASLLNAQSDLFVDAACTLPAAFTHDTCGAPTVITDDSGGFFAVYADLSGIYSSAKGSCTFTPTPKGNYFSVGAPIPASAFASLAVAHEGNGRIQTAYARAPTGERTTSLGFYDSAKAVQCTSEQAGDGVERCLPKTLGSLGIEYLDAACAQPVYRVVEGPAPAPSPGTYLSDYETPGCGECLTVLAVGPQMPTPGAVYTNGSGRCVPFVDTAGSTYYGVTPVSPTDFVEVTSTTE